MKPRILLLTLLSTVTMLTSCGPSLRYLGNYYEPTEHPKIYFREQDIEKDYEVMGRIYTKFSETDDTEKIQKAIINKTKKVGGDGVIMSELREYVKSRVSTATGGGATVGKKGRGHVGGGTSKSTDILQNEIECQVIKFKTP